MIIINSKNNIKPSINDFITYLLYWAKYNMDNQSNIIKIIQYYNPLNGNLYEWDLSDYIQTDNSYDKFYHYFANLKQT